MNKKLLIAAVGAALAAGSIAANAAPTVYGKLNLGVASVDNGVESSLTVSDDSSRIGIKGDEDLGGGLKAVYMFEQGIDADNGGFAASTSCTAVTATGVAPTCTTTVGGRDVYAGLQAGWGTLLIGHMNSSYKTLSTGLEIFGDTIGDFTHTTFGQFAGGETRAPNAIAYVSPDMQGFQVMFNSVRGEAFSATESNPMVIAATYTKGPLYVGIGRLDFDNQGTTGNDNAVKIAASFAFAGGFKAWVVNEDISDMTSGQDDNTLHLGVSYTMGNETFGLTSTNYELNQVDAAKQTSIGWVHAFTKNTRLNVVYSKLENEPGQSNAGRILSSGGNGTGGAGIAGDAVTGLQAQMSMSF